MHLDGDKFTHSFDLQTVNGPDRMFGLTADRPVGGEVVGTDQHLCRSMHLRLIQGLVNPDRPIPPLGRTKSSVQDQVAVVSSQGGEACMECGRDLSGPGDTDILW